MKIKELRCPDDVVAFYNEAAAKAGSSSVVSLTAACEFASRWLRGEERESADGVKRNVSAYILDDLLELAASPRDSRELVEAAVAVSQPTSVYVYGHVRTSAGLPSGSYEAYEGSVDTDMFFTKKVLVVVPGAALPTEMLADAVRRFGDAVRGPVTVMDAVASALLEWTRAREDGDPTEREKA